MNHNELYEKIKNSNTITKQMWDIFLELDQTSSVATQADLNEMFLLIRNRLLNNQQIIFERTGKYLTVNDFDQLIDDEIGDYSVALYKRSIKKNK